MGAQSFARTLREGWDPQKLKSPAAMRGFSFLQLVFNDVILSKCGAILRHTKSKNLRFASVATDVILSGVWRASDKRSRRACIFFPSNPKADRSCQDATLIGCAFCPISTIDLTLDLPE
jgi:hypothetical protein